MSERLNITELAERANLSRDRAKRVLDTCGVKRDSYRLYDAEQALLVLQNFTASNAALGHQMSGRGSDASPGLHLEALANAKAAAEMARARKLELDVASKEGRLVSREAVNQAAIEFSTHIRNGLLGFPARIAHTLVGAADAEAIERVLDDAIREELTALSDIDIFALSD